ncbi:MAG TPA: hypothetical protein DCM73_03135 [Clostridiales bacterium]|nr:hypothetical protein [Clostridiales bacterium]
MLSKIYELLKYCYRDNGADEIPEIETQLFLIAVKSLLPYEDKIGCMFDITRYEKEIELFKYYKSGQDENLEYYLLNKKPSEKEDRLLEFKIIPIIIANTQWDNLIDEALKAAAFYSVNKNIILDTILISSAIDEYLSAADAGTDDINEITRERLINFSFKEFLTNNNIKTDKSSLIEFEKERVKMLSGDEVISDDLKNKFKSLHYIYSERKEDKSEISSETVLSNFSLYLSKLRKGIIDPEKLKIPQIDIPEFRQFLKYPAFSHPLLGRCKVLKRGEKEVILRNKSGLMKVNI